MSKQPVEPQWPAPKNVLPEGTYKAKNIIIATGARPRVLPGIEPDGDRIWTYFEAMKPPGSPSRWWSWARAPSAWSSPPLPLARAPR